MGRKTAQFQKINTKMKTYRFKINGKDYDVAVNGIEGRNASVTVNGVSLTVCAPTDDTFTVAIIPYTFENTNFSDIRVGSKVNIEFDILGKYIARLSHFS